MNNGWDLCADVIVVGAGASGLPAAIGAARAGASVILVEEDSIIGGAPCDMYVAMLCGGPVTGILKEAHARLRSAHSIISGVTAGEWFLPASYLRVYRELLAQEPNIRLVTGARVIDALTGDSAGRRAVKGVVAEAGLGVRRHITGQIIVDATGTGAVAAFAGCETIYGRDAKGDFREPHAQAERATAVQACTWMYISQRLREGEPFDMTRLTACRLVKVLGSDEWFHVDPEAALRANPGVYLHWGCAVECKDTRNPTEVAKAQDEALAVMESDHALLRESGFAIHLAPRIGVRESCRVIGEHVVTENDLLSGELPDDTISIGDYGIDIWGNDSPSEEDCRIPGYGIPYRALVPRHVDGLLLAGKAISGTHLAMSAYRVQPIVASIGQAAGVAAALCVRQQWQPRQVDPEAVRFSLQSDEQRLDISFDRR